MEKVSSAEFQRNFSSYQDHAMREPIAITRHNKERLVLMSIEDYEALKRGRPISMHVSELSDEDFQAIMDAEVPPEYDK